MAETGEVALLEWVFKGGVSVVMVVGAYLWRGLMGRLEKTEGAIINVERDLQAHKLASAVNSYTKQEVNQMVLETKDSIKRIHEVIERMDEKIDNHIIVKRS